MKTKIQPKLTARLLVPWATFLPMMIGFAEPEATPPSSNSGKAAPVAVQQARESTAARRGEVAGRRFVGELGSTGKIDFEGNHTFPAGELRRALATDIGFVLASHPSAEFADFIPAVENALLRGYLHSGFPKAMVKITRDSDREGGGLMARITEGPRFRMGEVGISGTKLVKTDQLRNKLTAVAKNEDRSIAAAIRKSMKNHEELIPQPEVKAAAAIVDDINSQSPSVRVGMNSGNPQKGSEAVAEPLDFFSKTSSTEKSAHWTTGDPVSLSQNHENPMLHTVRHCLAELGHPLADISTSYDFKEDGTVDLNIAINDEGPLAIIGRIDVVGCTNHTKEEVARAAGLVSGQPYNPKAIDLATVSLWNCGRFFPFSIASQPRSNRQSEVDITIHAREIIGVPPLSEPARPELDTVRRFINTFNEWMVTGNFTDFALTVKGENGQRLVIGASSRDGMVFQRKVENSQDYQMLCVSQESILFELISGKRHGRGALPGLSKLSSAFINILPEPHDGKLAISAGVGFSSNARELGLLPIDMLFSPAVPFLKPERFVREGEQVVFLLENGTEVLRLDMESASLLEGGKTGLEIRDGVVRERQADFEKEISAGTDGRILTGWMEAALELARLSGMVNEADEKQWLSASWIEFSSLLLKPELTKPFKDFHAQWRENWNKEDVFKIPCDPAMLEENGGVMNLLVGLGGVILGEMIAPHDSWVTKLSRELLFINGGRTQYTSRTMAELLEDPSIGPFGCLVASQLVSKFDAATSRRFLTKAQEQGTAEGFRRDWQFWLDSPLGLGKALEGFITAMAAIDSNDEQKAADMLTPEQAKWFREFLHRLRSRPVDQEFAGWIAPQMDALWNNVLNELFQKNLKANLGPPHDPSVIAAVVNGHPVRRIFVQAIRESFSDRGMLQHPDPDPARPWTVDPALAIAVRFTLLERDAACKGFQLNPEQIKENVDKAFPHLKGQSDEAWIAEIGLSRDDLSHLLSNNMLMRGLLSSLTADVAKPSDAEIVEFYQKHGRDLSRNAHLHMLAGNLGDGASFTRSTRATRLVRQSVAALADGLPFTALRSAAQANERSGLWVICQSEIPMIDVSPPLIPKIEMLKAGEFSEPVVVGGKCMMICVEGMSEAETRPIAEVKAKVAALMEYREKCRKIETLCRQHEANAHIEVLDNPQPAPAIPSMFRELLKANPYGAVGKLGVFWEMALANDDAAAESLDSLLFEGFLDVSDLVLLADELLAHERKPLAALCVKEAASKDLAATRKAIVGAETRHKNKGTKGMQDQIGRLLEAAD